MIRDEFHLVNVRACNMSSIGLVFRTDRGLIQLPSNWVPPPLGSRAEVVKVLQSLLGIPISSARLSLRAMSLELELGIEDHETPRSITVSGVWGDQEMKFIRQLCKALEAKFYDNESSEFLVN